MRNSGYVRQVDSLGRLVLPIDLRKALGVQSGDSVEIFLDGDNKELFCKNTICQFLLVFSVALRKMLSALKIRMFARLVWTKLLPIKLKISEIHITKTASIFLWFCYSERYEKYETI